MSDPNKKKYRKWFKHEFELAKGILANEAGRIEWVDHDYQAFIYRSNNVCLVFYPHKTSGTGNINIRVRDQHSKNAQKAKMLMRRLYKESGNNNTFWEKIK